jgi:NAD(P)-dependent dehydrogenase (short-subunit alcohol dehydrogenase family)
VHYRCCLRISAINKKKCHAESEPSNRAFSPEFQHRIFINRIFINRIFTTCSRDLRDRSSSTTRTFRFYRGSWLDPDAVVAEIVAAGGVAAAYYDNLQERVACERIVECALDRFGRLDALIHNAGLVIFAELEETKPAVWYRMTAIGIDAPFNLVHAAIPHMKRANYSRIVLMTSGRAMRVEDCVPGHTAYSAAKMAQVGLMVGLAAELRDTTSRSMPFRPARRPVCCAAAPRVTS